MLHTERYADNRDAEQQTQSDVGQCDGYASDKPPDDIHQQTDTAARRSGVNNGRPKRGQGKHREFERLQSERDTDDSHHHQKTRHDIFEGDDPPAEYNPYQVKEKIHFSVSF